MEENKTGKKKELDAEIVLVATGRRPYTDGLNAGNAGVQVDNYGRVKILSFFLGFCIESLGQ